MADAAAAQACCLSLLPCCCRLAPNAAVLRQEFGQRDSPLMQQLTLTASDRPEVLAGVTGEFVLAKLCSDFLYTLKHVGVGVHSPPDDLDNLR